MSLLAQIYADPAGPGLAGNITKALYRSYRDASFAQALPQPAQHGILGPILHARVGDNITIVFQVCPSCFALEKTLDADAADKTEICALLTQTGCPPQRERVGAISLPVQHQIGGKDHDRK